MTNRVKLNGREVDLGADESVGIDLIAYASRTGTKRNLAGLRGAGWRLLVSATGILRHEGFQYALDNGAWTAFQKGVPFDEQKFAAALRKLERRAHGATSAASTRPSESVPARSPAPSFDGTNASRFAVNQPVLFAAVRQRTFDFGGS